MSTSLNTDMKVACPAVDAALKGYFQKMGDNHRSRFSLTYKLPQGPEEIMTVHYKLRNTQTGSLRRITADT